MAKPKRRGSSSKSKHFLTSRRVWLFVISIVLIGLMVWQVLLTLGTTSQATFNKQGVCRREHGNGRGWGGFSLCNVDKPNCAEGCTCVPFRPGFKFGRCIPQVEVTPTPTAVPPTPTQSPPGMLTCGNTCESDSQCASGYCHDPNWQACPTETPEPTQPPKPTCVPRPSCLDLKNPCKMPEPAGGFCPRLPTATPTMRVPRPTKMCPIRSNSLIETPKQCRDRECFAGEQCACPAPTTIVTPAPTDGVVCTADAKLCPDGSYVSRTGPSCEFVPCPGE